MRQSEELTIGAVPPIAELAAEGCQRVVHRVVAEGDVVDAGAVFVQVGGEVADLVVGGDK